MDDFLGVLGLKERRSVPRWETALTPDLERLAVRRRLLDHSRRIRRLETKISAARGEMTSDDDDA